MDNKMYQVSTLQALALGYNEAVVTAEEVLKEGDTGLGTFEGVDGELIVLDGHCYRADENGDVTIVSPDTGIPFCAVSKHYGKQRLELKNMKNIEEIRTQLTNKIEEVFGLNSMHIVRIAGEFEMIDARSEAPYKSHHITLKEMLSHNQREFKFENIRGTMVGVYFPDYMDGINMPGWHIHFLSEDRTKGGHVFDVILKEGTAEIDKINNIYINLPQNPAFDTYSLKQDLEEEIKSIE